MRINWNLRTNSIKSFLSYYWKADIGGRKHSPFVQSFIREVLEDDRHFYCYHWIEILSNHLKQDKTLLKVKDLGAGSRKKLSTEARSIASIMKTAVSPKWQLEFLFRLVYSIQPKTKLELGTSLGISTLYQHFANTSAQFYTLEGAEAILKVAQQNFAQVKAKGIQTILGNFDETLAPTLSKMQQLDYAFIDGNHRREATLTYFEQCLPYCHAKTVLVFDDIHWSKGMEDAWKMIQNHPKVYLSIDLFYCGLIFFQSDHNQKTALKLISSQYKPLKLF